ncbi:LuxR family transcriptional regulator [Cohnella suwonensis]|uniref:LuxR family transcriptional regulator n=1 Tax=Cohnella suwonensis TaxID=696072 RepID=A0ABW0M0W3_9BACL
MERTIVIPLVKHERTSSRTLGVETAVRSVAGSFDLTPRESEILELLAVYGFTNREIAERCVISEKTVKIHISNMMKKAGTGSIRKLFSMIFISMNDGLTR